MTTCDAHIEGGTYCNQRNSHANLGKFLHWVTHALGSLCPKGALPVLWFANAVLVCSLWHVACREAPLYKRDKWHQEPPRVWLCWGRTTTCLPPRPQALSPSTLGLCKPPIQVLSALLMLPIWQPASCCHQLLLLVAVRMQGNVSKAASERLRVDISP